MKRIAFYLLVCCILFGCTNTNANTFSNETESTTASTSGTTTVGYLIQENAENVISFPIPNGKSISAEEVTFIQDFIQDKLLEMTGETINLTPSHKTIKNKDQEYSLYSIQMESWLAYENNTHISIVFDGLLNRKNSAHPVHWQFALNYNPQTLQIIPFSEKYAVNTQLYTTFADLAEKSISEESAGVLPAGWDSFCEPIPTEKAFLEGLLAEIEFCYYLQENGVVISYPVPFALGDYKEVTIPYDKLQEKKTDDTLS